MARAADVLRGFYTGPSTADLRRALREFDHEPATIEPLLMRVFQMVREVLSEGRRKIPIEQITLESHLYGDLELDSLGMVELIMELEDGFDVRISDETAHKIAEVYYDYLYPELLTGSEGVVVSHEVSWAMYKDVATGAISPLLAAAGLSENAVQRSEELKRVSQRYGVQPFSVGFLCVALIIVLSALFGWEWISQTQSATERRLRLT